MEPAGRTVRLVQWDPEGFTIGRAERPPGTTDEGGLQSYRNVTATPSTAHRALTLIVSGQAANLSEARYG